jgi:RNA polymerase sigma factor (sigma-70 family)
MRFLARAWRSHDELADIRQEAYARVYEAAQTSRPHTPKAFLFTVTRHILADRVRRQRVVSIQVGGETDYLNVLIDEMSPERRVGARQELARLARAFERLPRKCREVVWQRRVKELSQREVGEYLGLSEKTVEKHLRDGVRLLAQYMHANTLTVSRPRAAAKELDNDTAEHEHGEHKKY